MQIFVNLDGPILDVSSRHYAVYSDLYKKEGEHSKAKENLIKAIEILKECGADGWVVKYEKELVAIS